MNLDKLSKNLIVGRGLFDTIKERIRAEDYSSVFFLTDTNLYKLYGSKIERIFTDELATDRFFILPADESAKSLEFIELIGKKMLLSGLDRRSVLVAIGGGVVTDIGGLAASLFMRGIDFVNVPTTLLGQIDAAIGGKCAVNLSGAKNLLGVFSIPRLVIADLEFLDTLSAHLFSEGIVELLKTAMVVDSELFTSLEKIDCDINRLDADRRTSIIYRAAKLKLKIVANDFRERGLRKILNLGHTTGHALETINGYRRFSHGQAVALGMLVAFELSESVCGLSELSKKRLKSITRRLVATTTLSNIEEMDLWDRIRYDKKKDAGQINFTLLRDIASPVICPVAREQFSSAYNVIKKEYSP